MSIKVNNDIRCNNNAGIQRPFFRIGRKVPITWIQDNICAQGNSLPILSICNRRFKFIRCYHSFIRKRRDCTQSKYQAHS